MPALTQPIRRPFVRSKAGIHCVNGSLDSDSPLRYSRNNDVDASFVLFQIKSGRSFERLGPGQPGDQGPAGTALHRQCPVHDEGWKHQGISLAESNPVAGPFAMENLDAAALVSAVGQLDDHR